MTWAVAFLNERVRDELSSPPVDVRARFGRIVRLVQSHGLEQIREPYVRHLEGPLWEMRLTGKGGIARRSTSRPATAAS
jgi:phage-related protein